MLAMLRRPPPARSHPPRRPRSLRFAASPESGEAPRMSTLLLVVPLGWAGLWSTPLAEIAPDLNVRVHERDAYAPGDIDYVLTFRPPQGLLKTLPNLKLVISLGAGVDGILADPEYPKQVPLVRFVDHTLSREMAQFCVLHVLMHYRMQRY